MPGLVDAWVKCWFFAQKPPFLPFLNVLPEFIAHARCPALVWAGHSPALSTVQEHIHGHGR